jgi:hypothetical protein
MNELCPILCRNLFHYTVLKRLMPSFSLGRRSYPLVKDCQGMSGTHVLAYRFHFRFLPKDGISDDTDDDYAESGNTLHTLVYDEEEMRIYG